MNGARIWAIEWFKKALLEVQEYVRLCIAAAQGAVSRPFYFRDVIEQIDVDTTNIPGRPEVQVTIDRDRAADLGVSVQNVASTLQMLVAGVKASTYPDQGEEYEIRIRADERYRTDSSSLSLMTVPSTKYGSVPLSSVVTWKEGLGPSRINRYARERQITLLANAAAGASAKARAQR